MPMHYQFCPPSTLPSPLSSAVSLRLLRCLGLSRCSLVEACGNCRPSKMTSSIIVRRACRRATSPDAAQAGLGFQPRSHADLCGTVDVIGQAEPHPRKGKEGCGGGKREESGRKAQGKAGETAGEHGEWRALPLSRALRETLIRCAVMQFSCTVANLPSPTPSPQGLGTSNFPTRPEGRDTCSLACHSAWRATRIMPPVQTRSPKRASGLEAHGLGHGIGGFLAKTPGFSLPRREC